MKAVVLEIKNKKASVLCDDGSFKTLAFKRGMAVGCIIAIAAFSGVFLAKRLAALAACICASVFAVMYILYYLHVLNLI